MTGQSLKKANRWYIALFTILLTSVWNHTLKGQDLPIVINFAVPPPYSPFITDYEDKIDDIIFNLNNLSNTGYPLYFHGELQRIEGGRVFTNPSYKPAFPFNLGPMESQSLTAADLANLNQTFRSSNLSASGIDIDNILGRGILPEGTYRICITALDFNTDEVRSMPGTGCSNPFAITHANPPRLNTPSNEFAFCDPNGVLQFQWTPVMGLAGSQIEYDIEMIDLTALGMGTEDPIAPFVDGATRFYTVENLMTPFYQYFIGMSDLPFEAGHHYAWRVRARDVNEVVFIRDDGYSEVFTFHYNCEDIGATDFKIKTVFPKNKDSIPYRFPYLAIEFEPFSERYTRMSYDLEVNLKNGDVVYSKSDAIPFGTEGPLARMKRHLPEVGKKRAAIHPLADVRDFPQLPKGFIYEWRATVRMEHPEGNLSAFILNNEFFYGMRKPKLESPAKGEKVAPGNINFRFHTGKKPSKIAPDSIMIHMPQIHPVPTFHRIESPASETFVLEVYKTREGVDDLDKRIYSYKGTFTGGIPSFDPIDKEAIENDLFRMISHESTSPFHIDKPEGEPGPFLDTLYWQIVYLNNPDKDNEGRYQKSKVSYFVLDSSIGSEESGGDEDSECGNNCELPEIADRSSRKTISINEEITVGKFKMTVNEITSSSANSYNGKGVIEIPFLANIKLKVQFRNMLVNNAGQFYSGSVEAMDDPVGLNFTELSTGFGTLKQLEEGADRDAFESALVLGGRLTSMLASGMEIGLPVGLDTDIGGSRFILGIVGAEFEPREANIQVMMYLSIPEAESEGFEAPGFGAQLCINPNGFGPDKLLYMVGNLGIPFGGEEDFVLRIKGASPEGGSPDTNRISYIELDCNGFKAAQIAIEAEFPRSMMVPENPDGSIKEEGRVKGFSRFKITGSDGWIAQFTMDKFQIAGLENWTFHVNDAYLDFSDNENPVGFKFPKHYGNTSLSGSSDPAVKNRWQGFYLKNLTVYTPRGLTDDSDSYRFHFGIKDLLIDNTGFSASIFAANIAQYKEMNEDNMEPKISGWAISLDTVSVVFTSNNFISGGISGKIGLPITEQTQYLKYKLALERNPTTQKFKFKGNVKPDGTLTIPMVIAQLELEQSSQLYFEIGSSSKAGVKLTGNLGMSKDFNEQMASIPGDFEMPGLRFENLEIDTKDGFKGGTLADRGLSGLGAMGSSGSGGGSTSDSKARSVGGFPLSIESISFNANGFNPVLSIEPMLSFSSDGEGLAMATTLNFEFKYDTDDRTFGLERLSVSSITLDLNFSAVKLKGRIEFYNRPHGDGIVEGFKGELEVKLPMNIEAKLAAEFGVYKVPETTRGFGSEEFFGYFSLDAEVRGLKVTLMPAIQLTGLAGGFYHRMRQENSSAISSGASMMGGSGSGPSGARYVIDHNIVFGMNFKAMFCFPEKCDLYSLDVGFGMSFRNGGELGHIGILGELYVMTDRSKGEIPKVYAGVQLHFNNPPDGASEFNGQFVINLAVGPQGRDPILRGKGRDCPPPPFPQPSFPCYTVVNAHLFIPSVDTENRWFFHMGKPSPESARGGLELDIVALTVDFTKYLMIGNEIPINLPPLPAKVERVLGNQLDATNHSEVNRMAQDRTTKPEDRANAQTGSGFAFGASFEVGVRLDIAIFYFALEFLLGFDINLTKSAVWCYGSGGDDPFLRGKNGWYAQGQVYAYLMADLGIQVNLLFIRGEFSILRGEVAMALEGRLPNPEYFVGRAGLRYSILGGMVSGQCNFKAEFGEKCEVLAGNPFGDVPFIGDVKPQGNNSNNGHSVFSNADIAFNWPINTILPFPKDPDDPEAGVRYIHVSPEYARIRNLSNNRIESARWIYSNENYALTIEPRNWLEGHRNYRTEIRLRGREKGLNPSMNPLHWGPIRYPDPIDTTRLVTWHEERTEGFRTGPRPNVIVEENVHHTYPLSRQRYFLQGEGQPYLRQFVATNELFANPFEGVDVRYIVRFRPVRGGDDIEVPFRAFGFMILMEQPNLANSTLYQVDFIREPDLSALDYSLEMINREVQMGNVNLNLPPGMRTSLASVFEFRNLAHDSGDATIEKRRVTTASIREDKQTILYTYHFQTSRYNTLMHKLWPVQFDVTGSFFHMAIGLLSRSNLVEPFEQYDLNGYTKNGQLRVPPLVQFRKHPISTAYHNRINADYNTYNDYYNFATNIAWSSQWRRLARNRLARNETVFTFNGVSPEKGNTVRPTQRSLEPPLYDYETTGGWRITYNPWNSTPDTRLYISYEEAALVFNQTNRMKNKIQSVLNYHVGATYPFQLQLAGNQNLNWRVHTFLNRPAYFYAFNGGWYYFRAEHIRPNPWYHPNFIQTNHNPITGTARTWSFNYNR
ncbi:MAG: hypothetical protein EA362_13920 [Saprospirales bacterium]|nr:MAG: hypothetical protein EA362_13920 [Saprospirales bacterium]